MLAFAEGHLAGAGIAEVRLPRTWVATARCTACGDRASVERAHVAVHRDGRDAACTRCGALREPETVVTVGGSSPFAGRTLQTLGFAPADVARVTRGPAAVYVRLDGAAGPAPGTGEGRTP